MSYIALLVIMAAKTTLGDTQTAPPVGSTTQVNGVSSQSPWTKVLENSCKKFKSDEMCKYRDVLTGSQHWQVLKLKGEPGADLVNQDACEKQENSIVCNSGKTLKNSYKKLKLMLDNSKASYTDRFHRRSSEWMVERQHQGFV